MRKLTFEDLERIDSALTEVERVIDDINMELIKSCNYSDLQVISLLKIKLDEVERILLDKAEKLKEKGKY